MIRIEARAGRPFTPGLDRRRHAADTADAEIIGRTMNAEYVRRVSELDAVDARARARIAELMDEAGSLDEELGRNAGRLAQIQAEIRSLIRDRRTSAQVATDNLRVLADVVSELRPTGHRYRLSTPNVSSDERAALTALFRSVDDVIPTAWSTGSTSIELSLRPGSRAYARRISARSSPQVRAEVSLSSTTDVGTAVHEHVHVVQFEHAPLYEAETYYLRRVAGVSGSDRPIRTVPLGGNYRPDEMRTVVDSLDVAETWVPNPYIIKVYPERTGATEVSTMIIQHFADHGADVTGLSDAWAAPRSWMLGMLAVL